MSNADEYLLCSLRLQPLSLAIAASREQRACDACRLRLAIATFAIHFAHFYFSFFSFFSMHASSLLFSFCASSTTRVPYIQYCTTKSFLAAACYYCNYYLYLYGTWCSSLVACSCCLVLVICLFPPDFQRALQPTNNLRPTYLSGFNENNQPTNQQTSIHQSINCLQLLI